VDKGNNLASQLRNATASKVLHISAEEGEKETE
jgi:hypothetical protein